MNLELINQNREKFSEFNRIKVDRFLQLLPNQNIKRVICTIPLLLSVNSPKAPGYIVSPCAYGVFGFTPDEDTKRYIANRFSGLSWSANAPKPFVQMMSVIGSVGTIAYNKKSDFDYWVCVDRTTVTNEEYVNFRKKVEAVQKWAEAEMNLSVHLFVNDVNNLQKNKYDEDEDEAFGSTMGALLKDEFYRSSIIVSGKVPFWWVVPVTTKDGEYQELWNNLPTENRQMHYVDIGNLYRISKEDFLGAALFQIVKSLHNPFKSILKLGVLHKYLFDSANAPLISQKMKHFIQQGQLTNTILDSYLMMFREVFDYYAKAGADKDMLEVLKMNLYLKINPQLSKYTQIKTKAGIPYRVEEMFRSAKQWQWNMELIRDLDNFENWDYTKVMKFWDKVQKFMLLSYQKISGQFPNFNLENKISDSDFKLLTRKIRSHYSRDPEKIDQFITFKDSAAESLLYIEPVMEGVKSQEWRLYKKVSNEQGGSFPVFIRSEKNLVKLAAWTVLNGVYDPKFSRITIESGYERVSKNTTVDFMNSLAEFFTETRMKIKNKYMVKEVFNALNFVALDFNRDSSETLQSIHLISHTSWGESFVKEFSPGEGIAEVLVQIIKDGIVMKKQFDDFCIINAPEVHKKPYKDIFQLYRDAYNFVIHTNTDKPLRFIAKAGNSYVVLTNNKGAINAELYPNILRLFNSLTLKPVMPVMYKFNDIEDPSLATLIYAAENAIAMTITIFYEYRGEYLFAYVVNETGNIFIFMKPKQQEEIFLSQLYIFSKNVITRVREINRFTPLETEKISIKFISPDRMGKISAADKTLHIREMYFGRYAKNSSYTVIVNKSMGPDTFYNIKFPDGIESGFMTNNDMYSICVKLKSLQASGSKIQNVISDITFTGIETKRDITTTPFFTEKYTIEVHVDRFMNK